MIERAGARIRVHLTGHLNPSEAQDAAARLTTLADQILDEIPASDVARVMSDALAAIDDRVRFGMDREVLARMLARRLIEVGYRPPQR